VNNKENTNFKPWQTFSIFISSTFADMQSERDHLKNVVFPKVEVELRKRQIRLETVDLRWGVDTSSIIDESERETKVLQVCLEEIKRCRPFFIGLLGDRYGWIPPEKRMKEAIRTEANLTHKKGKSVTALEIEFGVLASEEQLNRSVFYFRDRLSYDIIPEEIAARYCDRYDPELTEQEKSDRKTALDNLKAEIIDHFDKKGLKDKVKNYTGTWDQEQQEVIGLTAWGDKVYEDIIRECNAQAKETGSEVSQNIYEQEEALLDAFIEDHTHITTYKTNTGVEEIPTFCGREELLKDLEKHLLARDKEKWGLVLTGKSGSGKSAVFSMLYRMLQRKDCVLLGHSAGISPSSKNVADLLHKWNRQLSKHLGIEYEEAENSSRDEFDLKSLSSQQKDKKPAIEEIQQKFKELLFTAAEKEQVIIMIDALDRFEPTSRARNMTWLPQDMPGNIRMLCTAITGTEEKAVEYHSELVRRSIDHFDQEEAEEMLKILCRKQHKNMPDKVKKIILNRRGDDDILACSSPLWLSLAVNILMAMDNMDFDRIRQKEGRADLAINDFMQELAVKFPAAPGELFLSLINKAASYFGEEFTRKVFDHIACSRNGLRESDLEKLIPETKENWDALTFANIRRWFRAHLKEVGEDRQWNLAHSILRNSLQKEIKSEETKIIHNAIADHLLTLPSEDTLKISGTMFHLMQAKNAEKALGYYLSHYIFWLSTAEKEGAAKVIAEAITTGKNGIDWVFTLLKAAENNTFKTWRLAPRFIYDLDDILMIEGNLVNRIKILQKLKTNLIKTGSSYKTNADYGYNLASLYEKLGSIYHSQGNYDQTLQYYKEYNKLMNELYVSNPKKERIKRSLAISYEKLGFIYQSRGNFDQALQYYNEDMKLSIELNVSYPQNEKIKKGLAGSYLKLGEIYQSQGNFDKAMQYYNEMKKLFKELFASNPQKVELKKGLAISYEKLGSIFQSQGHFDQALQYYKLRNDLGKELYANNPQNEELKNGLAASYSKLGEIFQSQGHFDQALEYLNEFNRLMNELHVSNPQNEGFKNGLAISYSKLGEVYQSQDNFDQALEFYNEFNKLMKELYAINPQNEMLKYGLAISYSRLGPIYKSQRKFYQALQYYNEYNKLMKELRVSNPRNEEFKHNLAISYQNLGIIYQSQGHFDQALKYLNEFNRLMNELHVSNPQNEGFKNGLAISYSKLGSIYQKQSNFDQALQYYNEYNKLMKELYVSNPQNVNLLENLGISYAKLVMTYKAKRNDKKGKENYAEFKRITSELARNFPQIPKYQQMNQFEYKDL
jgi:tetratricopeptide (TPR) repeat protein